MANYRTRVYRQRNSQAADKEKAPDQEKFFGPRHTTKGKSSPFFQAKDVDTATSGDKKEKQADEMAKQVVNSQGAEKKDGDTIQKLATPEEDKSTATTDERMKNDKEKQS